MVTTAGGLTFLSGTLDYYVRGYDVRTGKKLWEARLPAGGQATPMTDANSSGRQYVLVTAVGMARWVRSRATGLSLTRCPSPRSIADESAPT
jgi:glucose dehydrogenase